MKRTFVDPLIDCKTCKGRFRADKLGEAACLKHASLHPGECEGQLTEPRAFNMMFKTQVGPIPDPDSFAYLRPETAQGMFVNFKNVLTSTNRKLPFGMAQIANRSATRSRRATFCSACASSSRWRSSIS